MWRAAPALAAQRRPARGGVSWWRCDACAKRRRSCRAASAAEGLPLLRCLAAAASAAAQSPRSRQTAAAIAVAVVVAGAQRPGARRSAPSGSTARIRLGPKLPKSRMRRRQSQWRRWCWWAAIRPLRRLPARALRQRRTPKIRTQDLTKASRATHKVARHYSSKHVPDAPIAEGTPLGAVPVEADPCLPASKHPTRNS